MRGRRLAVIAVATLSGCAMPQRPPRPCVLSLATSVPLEAGPGLNTLAVPASVNTVAARFLLDTGSMLTAVSGAAVSGAADARSGVDALGHVVISGVGGASLVALHRLPELRLGRLHGAVRVAQVTLPTSFADAGLGGVLGYDLLGNYEVDLDLWGGALRLFTTFGDCHLPHTALSPPQYAAAYLPGPAGATPRVPVSIAGQSLVAIVDTGASTIALSRSAALRLGIGDDVLLHDRQFAIGGFGPHPAHGRLHMLARLTIGGLTLRNVPTMVLQDDPADGIDVILGMDLMRRVHVWMSRASRQLIMQYPPTASR